VYFLFCLLLVVGASPACVANYSLVSRDTAELKSLPPMAPIAWFAPAVGRDASSNARWRMSVGPPVIPESAPADPQPHDAITIVSWNTAVGAADIVGFVRSLPDAQAPLVLLLQEVYRGGPEVPAHLDTGFSFAGRLGGAARGPAFREIEDVGLTLGLSVYYVPSMRNGAGDSDEDRGNAILANIPLTDLRAMELPFERQRRVAIAATLAGRTAAGRPWHVRVVSAHLDNMGGLKRAWIASEYARARQARGLTALLQDDEPTILAGDFNTWFGFSDQAYIETARAFPQTRAADRRATFHGLLRLDHVFFRLAPGWRADFHRAPSRFGSDHYPLVGTLQFS
jgi:endonuclease/exonuclease/phosphatase family metal-dependent hydrolase